MSLAVWVRSSNLVIRVIKDNNNKNNLKTKKYSDYYKTPFGNNILEKELMILERELQGSRNILSVGCGAAVHEIQLSISNPDLEIICLDTSKTMLIEAQELSKEIKLLQGSAEQLPLKNEFFDCVYFITSFEFIDDTISALTETLRVLKLGGKALFLILNSKSWYFQKEYAEADSYITRKIKHLDYLELKQFITDKLEITSINYALGIKGDDVFDTEDPKWASLYVVSALKLEVVT